MLEQVGGTLERFMTMLSARQKVIASNIANADTPGYKTRDVDFRTTFEQALPASEPQVVEAGGLTTRNDGNNVSLDREARLLAENALRFNIATNLARAQLRSIRTAIQDGRGA